MVERTPVGRVIRDYYMRAEESLARRDAEAASAETARLRAEVEALHLRMAGGMGARRLHGGVSDAGGSLDRLLRLPGVDTALARLTLGAIGCGDRPERAEPPRTATTGASTTLSGTMPIEATRDKPSAATARGIA